jgi:hypothetical protein
MDAASLLPLTEAQNRLVTAALLIHSQRPDAWLLMRPGFEHLAGELFRRGILNRAVHDGQAVYQVTPAVAAAMAVTDN